MPDEQVVPTSKQPTYNITVTSTPKFELTSYINNYKGRTVFRRLYLIAACCPPLADEATRMAVQHAKSGKDVQNYSDAVSLSKRLTKGSNPDGVPDANWMNMQKKRNASETDRLERELKGYKNNLIRESIRMGNEDLGIHYHAIGDLGNAVKAYSSMRDYCTAATHIASTAFRIIAVAIEQNNWLAVQSQVHKIRNQQMTSKDATMYQAQTTAAMGLQQMSTGEYYDAALSFLSTHPSLGDSYNEILTSNDVAVYGGLCALASMSRTELQTKVLESADFRNFLELEPHIRRAVGFFCASKYSQCLDILESYRADYLLDIYLQPHVSEIYQKIRTKSIVQYFQPFSRVTLESMRKTFGNPTDSMVTSTLSNTTTQTTNAPALDLDPFQEELITLIQSGALNARIDLESGILVATESDTRVDVQRETNDMMNAFVREARLKLMRLNAVYAGLEVKAPPKKKNWAGDGNQVAGMDLGGWGDENGSFGGGGHSDGNFGGMGYSLKT